MPLLAKELRRAAMFNARIETVDSTSAFRDAFKTSHWLIPADDYSGWTIKSDGKTTFGCC